MSEISSKKNASGRLRGCVMVSGRKQAKPSDDAYRVKGRELYMFSQSQ